MKISHVLNPPSGRLGARVIRGDGAIEHLDMGEPIASRVSRWFGFNRKTARVAWLEFCLRMRVLRNAILMRDITPVGRLYARVFRSDGSIEDLGLICTKVVTDAGVNFIVDSFQGAEDVDQMHFHAAGTDNTAEASSNTALGTEVESRATGSTTEGGSANIFRTVGTVSFTATRSIVEHGVLSASSGGTLLDRSVFTSIGVDNGDSIEFTYDLTVPSGS